MRTSKLSILLIIAFLLSGLVQANTWIVAKDGTGDFAEIQLAINAASSGDVIVVREGSYSQILIDGKPLTIVGAGSNKTTVMNGPLGGAVTVQNIAGGEEVVLSGFAAKSPYPALPLYVTAFRGSLFVDDLVVEGDVGPIAALNASASESGIFFLQKVIGNSSIGFGGSGDGACATFAKTKLLSVSQSSLTGKSPYGYNGYHGLSLHGGSLFVSHSSLRGGNGGNAYVEPFSGIANPGGKGGSGLALSYLFKGGLIAGGAVDLIQAGKGGSPASSGSLSAPGGKGGDGIAGPLSAALLKLAGPLSLSGGSGFPNGVAVNANVSQVAALPTCKVSGSESLGGTLTFQFQGTPGDQLFFLVSDSGDYFPVAGIEGFPLLLDVNSPSATYFSLGNLDSAGKSERSLVLPTDSAFVGKTLFVQGLVVSPTGAHPLQLTNVAFAVIREN